MSVQPVPTKKTAAKKPADKKEAKERKPREDYGYAKDAIISISKELKGYRGKRADWLDKVKKYDGKPVSVFEERNAGKDAPRGWLRFFAKEGAVTLTAPKK